jgi:hypothetical protein
VQEYATPAAAYETPSASHRYVIAHAGMLHAACLSQLQTPIRLRSYFNCTASTRQVNVKRVGASACMGTTTCSTGYLTIRSTR